MDKRTKILISTNILCLIFSLISLYGFIFVIEVSKGWRLFLVVLAIGWFVTPELKKSKCVLNVFNTHFIYYNKSVEEVDKYVDEFEFDKGE